MGEDALLPKPKIAPSMLSSDFANLASEAKYMQQCGADWLHMDIMDGHFVPNLTIGEPVIKSLRKHTDAFLDCHLMVTNPSDYVEPFAKAGASSFTFHLEAARDNWKDLIRSIKASGMRAAVALKPGTPIEEVYPLVESDDGVDMVLVMTVEPGFGGQKFMHDMMPKVKDLRTKYPQLDIQVINLQLSIVQSTLSTWNGLNSSNGNYACWLLSIFSLWLKRMHELIYTPQQQIEFVSENVSN